MFVPPLMTLLRPRGAPLEFFTSKVINTDWQMVHSPAAMYVASADKTFVSWYAVGRGGDKVAHVASFDHATNTWSRRYVAGNFTLADDDHGHCAMCRDSSGYIHLFFGSHASPQHLSSTNNPDDVTSWTQHAPLSGAQSYPHPLVIGSTIYLFLRNDGTLSRRMMGVRTASVSAGVPTFGSMTDLVDFEADSRVYTSECFAIGTDVHFACTLADEASDINRRHIYYFVYKTTTGALENHDGSVSTASGSLPVSLTTANASYRLINYGTDQGEVPSLAFDSAGNPHISYIQGPSGGPHLLYHIAKISGSWTSPVSLATITDQVPGSGVGTGFVDMHGLVAGAAGTMQAWYQNAAGDKLRRVRSASGVWSAAETIVVAGVNRLMGQQAVRDAHPDLRSIFSEVGPGPSSDAAAIDGKRYAHGDSGVLPFAMPAAGSIDTHWANVIVLLGAEHRDGSVRIINEADTGKVGTAAANAQADTAQSKFGSASILLDGTADFVSFAHDSALSVSNGDFTVECWVRRNATKLQCIAGKSPTSGGSEWRAFINASNRLQFQAPTATGTVIDITGTTVLSSTSTWYHVAFTRQGTTWRCFLDGVLEASGTESGSPVSNTQPMLVGRDQINSARDFNGWIDEFRFTAGVARYTASFTPPAAAFPRI